MANISRVSTLRLNHSSGTGHRLWVATADVEETAAGGSVLIRLSGQVGGGVGVLSPDELQVSVYTSSGSLIRRWSGLIESDFTFGTTMLFHFKSNGDSNGVDRCGTAIIDIRAIRSSGTSLDNYDVETDGSPATVPSGVTINISDRGFIVGTTTGVSAVSNIALGSGKNQPAEEAESVFHRLVLAHTPFNSQSTVLGVTSSVSGSASASATSSSVTVDATLTGIIDDRFAAGVQTLTTTAVPANNTGVATGRPWTTLTSYTADTITADPRLTKAWHFQKNKASFDLDFAEAFKMNPSDIGQAACRITRARTGSGRNGLTVTLTADPVAAGGVSSTVSTTTATRDGQDGWTGLVDVCPNVKPAGVWDLLADITAPASIDSNAHLVGSDASVLVSADRGYTVFGGAGPVSADSGTHWSPGMALQLGGGLMDADLLMVLAPGSPAPDCVVSRLSPTGQVEYLAADLATWVVLPNESSAVSIPLSPASDLIPGANPRIYLLVVPNTTGWSLDGLGVLLRFRDSDGNIYKSTVPLDPVSGVNRHDRRSLVVNPVTGLLDMA